METTPDLKPSAEFKPRPVSELLLPDAGLANCVFGTFVRDTRGCGLSFAERFNHFAASPLCCISWCFEGATHVLENDGQMSEPSKAVPMPRLAFSGPQQNPLTSWTPGDVHAAVLGFYPEAFAAISGINVGDYLNRHVPVEEALSGELLKAVIAVSQCENTRDGVQLMSEAIAPLWRVSRPRRIVLEIWFPTGQRPWPVVPTCRQLVAAQGKLNGGSSHGRDNRTVL